MADRRGQVLTSRNVRGGWLTDVALNYQIEHHLFRSIPRPKLRRSQPLIEAFCQQRGVPYCQSSLAGSYAQALRHLNAVGQPAPVPRPHRRPARRRPACRLYPVCRRPGRSPEPVPPPRLALTAPAVTVTSGQSRRGRNGRSLV
jgi:hypothetical protein